jgi:RNA polymerase sigma-70 factor (ECF subfamily)
MVQAQAGDREACELLLKGCQAIITAYVRAALARLPNVSGFAAEDIVQETLIAVYTKRATYDSRRPFEPWLMSIARYKLIDSLRGWGRRRDLPSFKPEVPELEAVMTHPDTLMDLTKLLQTVPERTRRAILRVKVEGWTAAEAAAAFGMTEVGVKVMIHRCLKTLRVKV